MPRISVSCGSCRIAPTPFLCECEISENSYHFRCGNCGAAFAPLYPNVKGPDSEVLKGVIIVRGDTTVLPGK